MLSGHTFLRRGALAACAVMVAGALATGCSTVGPDDSLNATGSLDGTVQSDRGNPVPSMEVCLWCAGTTEDTELEYRATTGESGTFELADIDLGGPHAFAKTYEVYVNRTRECTEPINDWYGTHSGTVSVERDPGGPVEFVITWIDHTPAQPSQNIEP
jgi:hypothetical protein